MLAENLNEVKERIRKACERGNRDINDVTLIAVSKTKPLSDIEEMIKLGVREFGENKVQELVDKYEHVSTPVNWHLIGHLQTNKVKQIIDKVTLIHSVDSIKLAKEIQKEAIKKDITVKVLVEVNIGNEESKFGLPKDKVMDFIEEIATYDHIQVEGLMCIAPFVDNPEDNRICFKNMKQLSLDITSKNIDNINMNVLSMGMTNDYEVAIEEGSTMVRVGTGLFGARQYTI